MASGIENVRLLQKALRHAEKTNEIIRRMVENGAQGERIFEAEKRAQALVKQLQVSVDAIDNDVLNRLNS